MSRVWMITGASSGFGRAIAVAALDAGDTVVVAVRRPESMADLAARHPARLFAVALDMTDHAAIEPVAQQVLARHGRVDVLVNNAGKAVVAAVEETTEAELRDLMEVHFFGPTILTRALLPSMRAQGSGAIVQLSSMGGRLSFPGVGAYSASKFALEGWSEALAQEVAPFGIRVLVLEPGAFRTGLNQPQHFEHAVTIPAYSDVVGPTRSQLGAADGTQPGDPAKLAAVILDALDAPKAPLRIVLGSDAFDQISTSLDADRIDLAAWEKVSRGTAFS